MTAHKIQFSVMIPDNLLLHMAAILQRREDYVYEMCHNDIPDFWLDELANINYLLGAIKHTTGIILMNKALSNTWHNALLMEGDTKLTAQYLRLLRKIKSTKLKSTV